LSRRKKNPKQKGGTGETKQKFKEGKMKQKRSTTSEELMNEARRSFSRKARIL
jgi:hypothetical protein